MVVQERAEGAGNHPQGRPASDRPCVETEWREVSRDQSEGWKWGFGFVYFEDGTEKRRDTYKDGEIVRASKLTKDELPLDKFYELEDLLLGDGEMVRASSRTKGELPLDLGIPSHQSLSSRQSGIEPSGDEKFYELKDLITNLGGPIKARYIDVELKIERSGRRL